MVSVVIRNILVIVVVVEIVWGVDVGPGIVMSLMMRIVDDPYLLTLCIQAGDQAILSLHRTVITQNDRVSLTYDEHNTWSLHIK